MQQRYNVGYTQCMYSRGDSVQSPPGGYPYPAYAYGAPYYPYPYGYPYGPACSPARPSRSGSDGRWGWGGGYRGWGGGGWGGGWHGYR